MTTRCIRASLREIRAITSFNAIASGELEEVKSSRPDEKHQNSQLKGHELQSISFTVRFSNSPIDGIKHTKILPSTAHGRKRIPTKLRNEGTFWQNQESPKRGPKKSNVHTRLMGSRRIPKVIDTSIPSTKVVTISSGKTIHARIVNTTCRMRLATTYPSF